MLDAFVSDVKEWVKKPYRDDMDLFNWVLFIGIWAAASILWVKVIRRVVD